MNDKFKTKKETAIQGAIVIGPEKNCALLSTGINISQRRFVPVESFNNIFCFETFIGWENINFQN